MDCWAVLGIDRTSDTAIIRKAYKQQLLVYHPEDDPAGYQKVRAAYTAAMNAAKHLAKYDEAKKAAERHAAIQAEADAEAETDSEAEENAEAEEDAEAEADPEAEGSTGAEENTQADAPEAADQQVYRRQFKVENDRVDDSDHDMNSENEEPPIVIRRFYADQAQDKTKAENDFMARLKQLFNDPGKRNDPEAWTELLSDDVLWDVQSKSRIEGRMLRLFSEHSNRLDDHIWGIIEAHTGLFDKISKKSDGYPARFVDTYALATQKIAMPGRLKLEKIPAKQILKKPDVDSWWSYCFKIPNLWIILLIIGNVYLLPIYLLRGLIRYIKLVLRRNWKIIMWEYTFSYINRWGKRYDFKYIDIIKVVELSDAVVIHLKGKQIRMEYPTENQSKLLAKLSRYGRKQADTIYMHSD